MRRPPTLEDLFEVMAAASVGDASARVRVPGDPDIEDAATRLGIALNLLLDDLALRAAEAERNARAAAAAEERNRFLAMISHEVRTPLNGVLGMTSILLATDLPPDQREMVEVIRRSGQHLLTVINDILDFCRLEALRLQLERHPFDVRQCVEDAIELVAAAAVERDLELLYHVDDSVPRTLVGDAGRLRQVLLNLVGNAVKFTRRGEVVVRAEARPVEDGGHEVHFRVEDTGIGIPPEQMARLFQPFVQGDPGAAGSRGGAGLGLVISKRLCELMGGSIWAESAAGKGSTFHFTIRAPSGPEAAVPARPRLARRILVIVDDNALSRKMLSLQVSSWGMTPWALATGEEALRMLESGERFDAMLIDYQMPVLDGLALARRVRAMPSGKSLPLILLVPRTIRRSDLPLGSLDVAAVLPKPLRASQLYDALVAIFAPELAPPRPRDAARLDPSLAARHPMTLLVADDNPGNQKVMLAMLERLGYQAGVASDGAEAVAEAARRPYDLILMDLHMPGMDGVEATCRILSRSAGGKRPQVVGVTADASSEERQRCFDAGMVDYLPKPLTPENLVPALERAWVLGAGESPDHFQEAAIQPLREMFRNEATVRDIVDTYLASVPPLLAELREAVAGKDAAAIQRIGHTLGSTATRLGTPALGRLARDLEELGRRRSLDDAAPCAALLEAEWPRAQQGVEAWKLRLR